MRRWNRALLRGAAVAAAGLCWAASLGAQTPLPQPLALPPGLVEVLPINKSASYVGDAVRIADCPEDKYAPFGSCWNVLFGGLALFDSHLSGLVQVRFYPPINKIAHFEISHPGNLAGDDALLRAPQMFQYPVQQVFVLDDLTFVSSGDLNLATGEVTNADYRKLFFNSFYTALGDVNPRLAAAAFRFPGPAGNVNLQFLQRPDGLLDVIFDAQTFLPLSNNINGDPVRMPLPLCGPLLECGSIQAPGSSLHPHIHFTTGTPANPSCGSNCPAIPQNSVLVFSLNATNTTVGDHLTLNIPQLGGNDGTGWAQLLGRAQFQFGQESGGTVPFVFTLLPPEGMLAKPPSSPLDAFNVSVGPPGGSFTVPFPALSYKVDDTVLFEDPFDVSVGAVDIRTGQVAGTLLHRDFVLHTLLLAVLNLNLGRLPVQSFAYRGPAHFENTPNGGMAFRFSGAYHFNLSGFRWPSPDFTSEHAFLIGDDSQQNQFLRVQAVSVPSEAGITKSASASNLLSSVGERFSYSYSVSCNTPGKGGSFQYSNPVAGGTFQMQALGAVSCTRSLGSLLPPGDYDTINFSGFGTWSADSNPHLATVAISTVPGQAFISIQIDAGLVSAADTHPASPPLP